ncbi:MAG: primosomal protein N' [Gammaproteobacteria bacterium]|nr:primosomal protein N' [Gammaproteobacteria bacterium]
MPLSIESKPIVSVAVPVPLRRTFDYQFETEIEPGSRVIVPFRNRQLVGMVIPTLPDKSITKHKNIIHVLDDQPFIPPTILKFYIWSANYYHYPIGEVIHTALPPNVRMAIKLSNPETPEHFIQNPKFPEADVLSTLVRARKQQLLYSSLSDGKCLRLDEIEKLPQISEIRNVRSGMQSLKKKGLVLQIHRPPTEIRPCEILLNREQSETLSKIKANQLGFHTHLIHGITGSGKTEIYIHTIHDCLKRGRQVLVLVPEISLTKQLVDRFINRFGDRVHCYHSGISKSERYRTWWKAGNGTAGVILGTRSAVFMPILNLARIIVDEEHDLSFKQMDGFRYHARDLAIKRASLEEIPIILGSATPSMESMHNAHSGKYHLSILRKRAGKANLPKIEFIDLRLQPPHYGLSRQMISAIDKQLENSQQTILYINRRGYAPIVECSHCKWQANCDRCDAYMTYHKTNDRLNCHHCGNTSSTPEFCPQCRSPLFLRGSGTQRIEESLERLFPDASILRFDRDKIRSFRQLQKTLDFINKGQVDIIVGTRMISKGHDFHGVTLVGIINPDQGLYSIDFRAPEQLFQDLMQVSGRSGRGKDPGRVYIQTYHPENQYMQMVCGQDYDSFFASCRDERKAADVPPFSSFALWRIESRKQEEGFRLLQNIKHHGDRLRASMNFKSVQIMDPVLSPIIRIDDWHRFQLLVNATIRTELHQILNPWITWVENLPTSPKLRWSLDIDPMEMY